MSKRDVFIHFALAAGLSICVGAVLVFIFTL